MILSKKNAEYMKTQLVQQNLNHINIQQDPNESEEDFIKRSQALEQENFDVNIYQDKAKGEQGKR